VEEPGGFGIPILLFARDHDHGIAGGQLTPDPTLPRLDEACLIAERPVP